MLKVYILSDSSGETAELVAKAAVSQFESGKAEVCRLLRVRSTSEVKDLFINTITKPCIIVYTLVLNDVKKAVIEHAAKYDIPLYDPLSGLLTQLEKILKTTSLQQPGLRLKVDESYFSRMDAIHYAIKFDDGQNLNGIEDADIVLIGVSRTGKTPACMYLAQHYGLKVANVPIRLGVEPPEKLNTINPKKITGLICDPSILQTMRNTTYPQTDDHNTDYCNLDRIIKEVEYSRTVFEKLKCKVVDMTNRAVEETAAEIVSKTQTKESKV